jgi:guanylate kinase
MTTRVTVKGGNDGPWLKKGLLFVVSAPSGAGKTTLCKEVVKYVPNLQHSVSYTTRPARPSEVDQADYHFISMDRFKKMMDEHVFIEWAVVHGNYYGTSKKDLDERLNRDIDVILDIDSQGASQIKKRFGNGVFIYVLPPSFEELRQRLTVRKGDTPDEIIRRLDKASEEAKDYRMYDYLIINGNFDEALKRLTAIILSARIRIGRVDPEWVDNNFLSKGGGLND